VALLARHCRVLASLSLRGSPPAEPLPSHARDTALTVPEPGEARGAALDDGFPVWLVRHADGTLSVLSAVASRERSGATLFATGDALVRWLPATHRLLAGDVAYDENGRVIGYAADDDCFDSCPRIAEPALDVRDLDEFAYTAVSGAIVVGARLPAADVQPIAKWVDYDRSPHAARELGPERGELEPLPVGSVDEAPLGSYALVAGSIVQSTDEPPRVCGPCGACDRGAPARARRTVHHGQRADQPHRIVHAARPARARRARGDRDAAG
jgi:hypothetical protein